MFVSSTRVAIILDYLQLGGKVQMDGKTYVWLNSEVVSETATHQFIIDGLAIEGRSYGPGEDWEDPNAGKPHYMGQGSMPINLFLDLIERLPATEYKRVCVELAKIRENMKEVWSFKKFKEGKL